LHADRESRSLRLSHPGWQTGVRAIGLEHDNERDAATFKAPPHHYNFAEAGMKPVGDESFGRMFAGSMLLFREAPGSF
jgi:hypothetical protein